MVGLIVNWVLSSVGLLAVSLVVPGFRVTDFESALIVALSVGLLTSLFGLVLRFATSTLALTLCAVFLVISDAFVFRVTALLVPGYAMLGFLPAFVGAVSVVLVHSLVRFWPRQAGASLQSLLPARDSQVPR